MNLPPGAAAARSLPCPPARAGFAPDMLAVGAGWAAQILFWQLAGWHLAARLEAWLLALPLAAYLLGALAGLRLPSRPLPALAWMVLTLGALALSLQARSLWLFSLAAALFGAGLAPLAGQGRLLRQSGRAGPILLLAALGGIAAGLAIGGDTLFMNRHLPLLVLALAACLAMASSAVLGRAATEAPAGCQRGALEYCGWSMLAALPVALAPLNELWCGAGIAGFTLVHATHYGVMLLAGMAAYTGRK